MKTFIIPQNNHGIIAYYENGEIHETGKIDIPYTSKSIVTQNRLIVSLCFGAKPKSTRLKIFDEHGKHKQSVVQLARKTEYMFTCINFKENTVYLGGRYIKNNGELFSCIDLTNIDLAASEVELPIKSIKGKSIDDILIRGNTLFLVDNIVYPKYIFEYDISEPNNPKHITTNELENNGTYEHIIKGGINDNWIALLSSTVGMRGANHHISLIGNDKPRNSQRLLSFSLGNRLTPAPQKNVFHILDICLLEDKLLILEKNALNSLEPDGKISRENITPIMENNENYNKLLKLNNHQCLLVNETKYKLLKI